MESSAYASAVSINELNPAPSVSETDTVYLFVRCVGSYQENANSYPGIPHGVVLGNSEH